MLAVAGKITGRKLIERGLIGIKMIDYMLLYNIGPERDRFRPRDPRAVDIINPSPHTFVKCK